MFLLMIADGHVAFAASGVSPKERNHRPCFLEIPSSTDICPVPYIAREELDSVVL